MATIGRFEELEVWKLAREQCRAVFELIQENRFLYDLTLQNQLNRSSGSVMDNISEGFDRHTRAEFRHFLVIARGSNAEVRSQLYRAIDRNWITEQESAPLFAASMRLGIKISGLIKHLDKSTYNAKPKPKPPNNTANEPAPDYPTQNDITLPPEFYQ